MSCALENRCQIYKPDGFKNNILGKEIIVHRPCGECNGVNLLGTVFHTFFKFGVEFLVIGVTFKSYGKEYMHLICEPASNCYDKDGVSLDKNNKR